MFGQRQFQAGTLSGPEQSLGAKHAVNGMLPARQSLHADDAAIIKPHLRLEQYVDLLADDRVMEIRRQPNRVTSKGGSRHANARAIADQCLAQRLARTLDHGIRRFARRAIGNTDLCTQARRLVGHGETTAKRRLDRRDAGGGDGGFPLERDHVPGAIVPFDHRAGRQGGGDPRSALAQQHVARIAPEGGVHRVEPRHCDRRHSRGIILPKLAKVAHGCGFSRFSLAPQKHCTAQVAGVSPGRTQRQIKRRRIDFAYQHMCGPGLVCANGPAMIGNYRQQGGAICGGAGIFGRDRPQAATGIDKTNVGRISAGSPSKGTGRPADFSRHGAERHLTRIFDLIAHSAVVGRAGLASNCPSPLLTPSTVTSCPIMGEAIAPSYGLVDGFGRAIRYLRISVTDRCDLRCRYCMAEKMTFLPRSKLLALEEIAIIAERFIGFGVRKIRLSGGEPLVRRDVVELAHRLGSHVGTGLDELTMTTNGTRLAEFAEDLVAAGVRRVNVSMDSRDPETFRYITRHGDVDQVLGGIAAASRAGLSVKINMVALRGLNEDQIAPMLAWCVAEGHDLSLIETMPLGSIDEDRTDRFVPLTAVFDRLAGQFDLARDLVSTGGPARYWRVNGGATRLGLISPLTANFCDGCNRVRMTTEGRLYSCLGHDDQVDLKAALRDGGVTALDAAILSGIAGKPERHDFVIERGAAPAVSRHMSVTGG